MVVVQRQSSTKNHYILRLRAHEYDRVSIKRKMSSVYESETRRARKIRGVLEIESLCLWYVRLAEWIRGAEQ